MAYQIPLPIVPRMGAKRLFLKEWRKFKKLTLEKVADRLDVAAATVSRYESGKIKLSVEQLIQFADAIGCEPDDFFHDPGGRDYQAWRIIQGMKPSDQERALRILETLAGADPNKPKMAKSA
jgi:transcriptional regulator with XRE-family HTH domain